MGLRLGMGMLLGASSGGSGPVTGIALTGIPDQKVFQFDVGQTYTTVSLAGTYTGGSPGGVEAQALDKADDSIIVDWTGIGGSAAGGSWSGTLQIPRHTRQYYVKVRAASDHTKTATGATIFYVGGVVAGYGQSNWLNHLITSSSPPAANAATRYFDDVGGSWAAVPVGNGGRNLLNDLATATGYAWGVVSGGQSGTNLVDLLAGAGTGFYETFAAAIAASGGKVCFILFVQGEGDGNTTSPVPDVVTYTGMMDTLHTSLAAAVGRSKANVPMLVGSLSTVTDGVFAAPDSCWSTIDASHVLAHNTYPNIYYSHSDKDAGLGDGVHWNSAAYGRSGKRFARSVAVRLGLQSTGPAWFIASVARVDTTHLDVTLTHSMGTDFTPTSGIAGFTVSGDNGSTWLTPSAAVRQSATSIRLTHASVAANLAVLVRYQFGKAPDVSAIVLDNGTLTSPLNYSAHQTLSAAGSASNPTPTFVNRVTSGSAGATQTGTFNLGASPAAADLFVIVGVSNQGGVPITSVTITPSGGSPITGTVVVDQGNFSPQSAIAQVLIPSGTAGINSSVVTVNYSTNPFIACSIEVSTVPAGDLSSQTAVDSDKASGAAAAKTLNISTSSGGFYIAIAETDANTSCTWSGTEAGLAERYDTFAAGATHSGADASNTGVATNSNTITATFGASGNMTIAAASWR